MRSFWKRGSDAKSQIRTLNKAREQVQTYLESYVKTLERESEQMASGSLKNHLFQTRISPFRATSSIELSCKRVHWIELVEFDLESERESWKAFLGESRQSLKKLMHF